MRYFSLKSENVESNSREKCNNLEIGDTVSGDIVECDTETTDNGVTLRQPYQWLITKTKLVSPQNTVTSNCNKVPGSQLQQQG